MAGRAFAAATLAVAVLLGTSGCAADAPSNAPITLQLADIQSGTVHLNLHQVARIDTGAAGGHYTALIADRRIVSVVQRRDETDGRLEPELVPLRVGTTQVALTSSGQQVIGFKVVITN
ncbi:MAG TPA: hypothetical protein VGM38_03675 [Pseudolysinimonas sp.]